MKIVGGVDVQGATSVEQQSKLYAELMQLMHRRERGMEWHERWLIDTRAVFPAGLLCLPRKEPFRNWGSVVGEFKVGARIGWTRSRTGLKAGGMDRGYNMRKGQRLCTVWTKVAFGCRHFMADAGR